MKIRNNWNVHNKQWDKFQIKLRVGKIDIISIEIDKSRSFYMITLFNFTIKNR
jgi:hypothetical protein